MKISRLIEELQQVKSEHGDLDCLWFNWGTWYKDEWQPVNLKVSSAIFESPPASLVEGDTFLDVTGD